MDKEKAADDDLGAKKTFNALTPSEKEEYRKELVEEHYNTLSGHLGEKILKEVIVVFREGGDKHRCLHGAFKHVQELINLLRTIFCHQETRTVKKVRSSFGFGARKPTISCDLECLMHVIASADIELYPELFRQSASLRAVATLHEYLSGLEIFPNTFKPVEASPTKLNETDEQKIQELIGILEGVEIDTISAVFKIVLKLKSPLFPAQYLDVYSNINQLGSKQDKIILMQFIVAFVFSDERRETLEVICCFLSTVIMKHNSPLRFRNIAVVFTPLFFIDDTVVIKEPNFKEPLNKLRVFLEFLLENGQEIFLIKEN
ncbi:hypothetical protein NEDG_00170 [Nematocida displodere]|uniref:Rho-GAP domain-containing protein n=1 Tax=Nematocida displodere TaxID=1805483 RepID=A0A177EI95_9MICR|nr:hypothetical protein NEDG_00170 [Nematocida displodere]